MPISPLMLSPETFPMNSRVNGIGLVIDTFQLTASPLMAPSKISVELPSAPCVPVSVSPELSRVSVALRSPIGVLMVIFQFPSTAIFVSPTFLPGKPEWLARSAQLDRRYSLSRHTSPTVSSILLTRISSGALGGRADPAADQNTKRDVLNCEGGNLGADQHDRHVERPQLHVAGHRDAHGAGAEHEAQCGPGIACE